MKKKIALPFLCILLLSSLFLFQSCGTDEEEQQDSLSVSLVNQSAYANSTVTFKANSYLTGDTSTSAVFYVNGEEITGNTYTPSEPSAGNQVYAVWNGLTSETVTFDVGESVVLPDAFSTKIIMEDYTGTWCGWCPRMARILNVATENRDNVIPIAIHCDADPYVFEYQAALQAAYGTTGLPKGTINRTHLINQYECNSNDEQYLTQIDPYLNTSRNVGLSLNSSRVDHQLNIDVRVGFKAADITNLKLVVYLLEDGLSHYQYNYFSGGNYPDCEYQSLPQPIQNFTHNHVLRKCYTDIFGEAIPVSQIVANSIYGREFNVTIPSAIENLDKLTIVAFLMGGPNNDVINAQSGHVGEYVEFD